MVLLRQSLLTTCRGSLKAKSFWDASLSVCLSCQQMGPCGPSVGGNVLNKPPFTFSQRDGSAFEYSYHQRVRSLVTVLVNSSRKILDTKWGGLALGPVITVNCSKVCVLERVRLHTHLQQIILSPQVIMRDASVVTQVFNVLINCMPSWKFCCTHYSSSSVI